ncbi:hypothetical protein D1AOALGA4SA_4820 [Olavius algarvensis Delta 1 endosymbiont]|nr:hypothetical protein D1AOALGA4SA_4820 [Olavius algarvensis Delta 1 endosymbiont]
MNDIKEQIRLLIWATEKAVKYFMKSSKFVNPYYFLDG